MEEGQVVHLAGEHGVRQGRVCRSARAIRGAATPVLAEQSSIASTAEGAADRAAVITLATLPVASWACLARLNSARASALT